MMYKFVDQIITVCLISKSIKEIGKIQVLKQKNHPKVVFLSIRMISTG